MVYISVEGEVVTDIDGAYIEERGIRWRSPNLWPYRRQVVAMRGEIMMWSVQETPLRSLLSVYIADPKIDVAEESDESL